MCIELSAIRSNYFRFFNSIFKSCSVKALNTLSAERASIYLSVLWHASKNIIVFIRFHAKTKKNVAVVIFHKPICLQNSGNLFCACVVDTRSVTTKELYELFIQLMHPCCILFWRNIILNRTTQSYTNKFIACSEREKFS